MILDATTCECLVYTFKEGVLSAMAHDLKLHVTHFHMTLDDAGALDARFDASSLRVVCARKDGHDAPHALPSVLFGEVERNIEKDVLKPRRFPEIRFEAPADVREERPSVSGTLTLCGVSRPITVTRSRERDARGRDVVIGRARIDQREFGITPFSAALGTLKVKPHVEIELRVVAPSVVT